MVIVAVHSTCISKMHSVHRNRTRSHKLCRVCMTESQRMYSVFKPIESLPIVNMLMEVTSVQITEDDGLPSTVCMRCVTRLHDAFEFKKLCVRTEAILRHLCTKTEHVEEEYLEDENVDSEQADGLKSEDDVGFEPTEGIKVEHSVTERDAAAGDDERLRKPTADTIIEKDPARSVPRRRRDAVDDDERCFAADEKPRFTVDERGVKVYVCTVCQKQYKYATSLKVHTRSHTGLRPFLCTHCGKNFKQLTGLSYHMRSHTGERPFECGTCHKRYRQSASLKTHMRVHTGQRPFLCSVCGKGFRQAPDLSYHMRTHTNEKPYMCTVCGKRMSMSCHLVQHMRTHTGEKPFSCSECGKSFASTTRLKRHEIIHTSLKPYVCDVCDKAFNRSSTLRVHSMIHTDERPHVCPTCGRGFIQAHCLRSHMSTHIKPDQGPPKDDRPDKEGVE